MNLNMFSLYYVSLLFCFFEGGTVVLIAPIPGNCSPFTFMPPTLKKWGAYWFRVVRVCVRLSFRSKKSS